MGESTEGCALPMEMLFIKTLKIYPCWRLRTFFVAFLQAFLHSGPPKMRTDQTIEEFTPLIHYHGCLPNFLGSQMFFPLQNFQYVMNFESQSSVRGNRERQDTLSCEQHCFNLYINAVDEAILPRSHDWWFLISTLRRLQARTASIARAFSQLGGLSLRKPEPQGRGNGMCQHERRFTLGHDRDILQARRCMWSRRTSGLFDGKLVCRLSGWVSPKNKRFVLWL
jgi:hypothetical protein